MAENRDFNFLDYLTSIERMMSVWHEHSQATLKHPGNLGGAREHFVMDVLARFMPSSVTLGSGEITDGKTRSKQQDVILYRADFPVIQGTDYADLYLNEGVIATIEVKSDLSAGKPTGLSSAFENQLSVASLANEAITLEGDQEAVGELMNIHTVATFVVGYHGWSTVDGMLEGFRVAANQVNWRVPDVVYSPSGCIVRNTAVARMHRKELGAASVDEAPYALCTEHPFAVFAQILFRAVMTRLGSLTAASPGIDAVMLYPLNNYFNLPDIPCKPLELQR